MGDCRHILAGLLLAAALALPLSGAAASKEETLAVYRETYREAVRLIKAEEYKLYYKIKPSLRDYVLYPYLRYTELVHRLDRFDKSQMINYMEVFKDLPIALALREHWLKYLVEQKDWKTFADHYVPAVNDKALACHYGYALHRTGRQEEMMQQARKLWLVGYSQPDECNPVFRLWRDREGLDTELAWQRYALAIKSNEFTLGKYLGRMLAAPDQPYAELLTRVQKRPEIIMKQAAFKERSERMEEIILYGVRRLARYQPENAFAALKAYEKQHSFQRKPLEETWVEVGVMLSLFSAKPVADKSLPVKPRQHPRLMEAQLRNSLRQGDWSGLPKRVAQLPSSLQNAPRWRYWTARSLAESEGGAEQALAEDTFHGLAEGRSFYGFLSAELLGLDYSYRNETRKVPERAIRALLRKPGIERALELFALGERNLARREWYAASSKLTPEEAEAAAILALRRGWYKAAITTLIHAEAWNQLDTRFPLAYRNLFATLSDQAEIPLAWGLAIARQESAFMPDARSPSGALGIMQLMPSTAKKVAEEMGVSYAGSSNLLEPTLNIALGTDYLGQMLRRFDNNRVLASAAYNAGPTRVEAWVKAWLAPTLPVDVWVEAIPFTETRNYVQNVLMFSSIYSHRMKQPLPLLYENERAAFGKVRLVSSPAAARAGEDI